MTRRLLPVLLLLVAACGSTSSTGVDGGTAGGTCTMPLHTKADFDSCQDNSAQPIGNEDTSIGALSRHVWTFTIASKDPNVITAALATAAHGMALGVTEHTLFAFANEDRSVGYNRGRLVLGRDGVATFDICTATEIVGSGSDAVEMCGQPTTFTVNLGG